MVKEHTLNMIPVLKKRVEISFIAQDLVHLGLYSMCTWKEGGPEDIQEKNKASSVPQSQSRASWGETKGTSAHEWRLKKKNNLETAQCSVLNNEYR